MKVKEHFLEKLSSGGGSELQWVAVGSARKAFLSRSLPSGDAENRKTSTVYVMSSIHPDLAVSAQRDAH